MDNYQSSKTVRWVQVDGEIYLLKIFELSAILVHSLTSLSTLEHSEELKDHLLEAGDTVDIPLVVAGYKWDLECQTAVDRGLQFL